MDKITSCVHCAVLFVQQLKLFAVQKYYFPENTASLWLKPAAVEHFAQYNNSLDAVFSD